MLPPLRTSPVVLGIWLLTFVSFAGGGASSVAAQDRGMPRFGPMVPPDTVQAGQFDFGRLWSFADPPLEYLKDRYDVAADARGVEHMRKGTVRLPTCSGAMVSPEGLVVTADHCVRPFLSGEASDRAGFYADEDGGEKPLSDFYVERLVAVENVTEDVDSVAAADSTREAPPKASAPVGVTTIQQRRQRQTPDNHRVQVVSETGGDRFVAYTYRRYEDVRLVLLPDAQVSAFEETGVAFSYPRHAWEVAMLRVYDANGQPLQEAPHYDVGERGVRPGDPVFAVGHPKTAHRMETHSQTAFRRDVQLPARRSMIEAWTQAVQSFVADSSGTVWGSRLAMGRRALKRTTAQWESLKEDYIQARLQRRTHQLEREEEADSAALQQARAQLETLQAEKRAQSSAYRAFAFHFAPRYSSGTLRRALLAREVQGEDQASRERVLDDLRATPQQPLDIDAALMATHLQRMHTHLDAPRSLDTLLQTGTLQAEVKSAIEASPLSEVDRAVSGLKEGDIAKDDPVLRLIEEVFDDYASFRDAWRTLTERERGPTKVLAREWNRTLERPVALSQERVPRMSDGRIQGYPYNGTLAPPFTTFFGLYGRYHSRSSDAQERWPSQWTSPPRSFDRSTPLVTVASTDLGGSMQGGPLLDDALQFVGVVVGENIQSAGAGAHIFLPHRMRAVAVDVRGMLAVLSEIYEAESLVRELTANGMEESSPSVQ